MLNTILSKLLAALGVVVAGAGVTVAVNVTTIHQSPNAKIETATVPPARNTEKVQDRKPIDGTKISKNPTVADPTQTNNRRTGDIEGDDMPKITPEEEGFKDRLRIVTYPK